MTSVPPRRPDEDPQRQPARKPDRDVAPRRWVTPSGEAELGTDGPGAIVVGVDGSETSLRALAYAAGLARRQCTQLVAVYVRQPLRTPVALSGWVDAGIVAAEAQAQKDMEDEVWTQIASDVAAWGCGARVVIRNGSPLAELRKVAEQANAEMIIVGASAGLRHRLFGSVGHRLLRGKPCPVTIVP
ncbi:MAG TPA: universal stress protein [Streptosporangiaceae bacterium]|nr:universal stress protein [Streptosporangiaceae bacterium]